MKKEYFCYIKMSVRLIVFFRYSVFIIFFFSIHSSPSYRRAEILRFLARGLSVHSLLLACHILNVEGLKKNPVASLDMVFTDGSMSWIAVSISASKNHYLGAKLAAIWDHILWAFIFWKLLNYFGQKCQVDDFFLGNLLSQTCFFWNLSL